MEQPIEEQMIDPAQQAQMEEEWRAELAKTEDEINTLKQVLASKQQEAAELKRKLGITAWNEWTTGALTGVANLKETAAQEGVMGTLGSYTSSSYSTAAESLKGVGEKTSSLFGGLGFVSKIGAVKESAVFKSVGEAVGSVKSKMTGSNSSTSFEDALNTMEQQRAQQAQDVTQ